MDFGLVLSTTPPIVEHILKYVNHRDLDSCSKVCELWHNVAKTEKKRRGGIFWFFQALRCGEHEEIHSSCQECSLSVFGNLEDPLSLQLRELKIKPKYCLALASSSLIDQFRHCFPSFQFPPDSQIKRVKHEDMVWKRAYLKAVLETAVGKYLPEDCKTTFCVTPGIVGSNSGSLPFEIEEGHGISGLMISKIPGLQIFTCPIDDKHSDISKLVPEGTHVKCLLVFKTSNGPPSYNKIIQSCLVKENSKVAIGGAVVERSEAKCGSAIAFCGPNVDSASIIIRRTDDIALLKEKLNTFKETGLLEGKCFAFMFACVARGYYFYREYNKESSVFHELYPDVPLIGVFGNGEIGVDYLPNIPGKNENEVVRIGKLARSRKKVLHSYTTVFVLVSLNI